jgi:hypothetical protein
VCFDHPVMITIKHPGSTTVTFKVQARDISQTGLKVCHTAFVYPGSPAEVAFTRGPEVLVAIRGHVVRCAHAGGNKHDVGIAFDAPIGSVELSLIHP